MISRSHLCFETDDIVFRFRESKPIRKGVRKIRLTLFDPPFRNRNSFGFPRKEWETKERGWFESGPFFFFFFTSDCSSPLPPLCQFRIDVGGFLLRFEGKYLLLSRARERARTRVPSCSRFVDRMRTKRSRTKDVFLSSWRTRRTSFS